MKEAKKLKTELPVKEDITTDLIPINSSIK